MKKAVIQTGSKQYLVGEGETVAVELLQHASKTVTFDPLLVIDGEKVSVGMPFVKSAVTAEIVNPDAQAEKVVGVRFEAKKRVHKVHGHRQHQTILKISSIV